MSDQKKIYWTDDPELVERYVLGKLTAEEMERLDREITDCEPCKAIIANEVAFAAGIRRHGRDRMKADLRKKLRRDRASQFYSYQYIGMAAAVVVIAIGIGLYQIWFSDLVAPRTFRNPQIIITTGADSVGKNNESDRQLDPPQKERSLSENTADQKKAALRDQLKKTDQSVSGKTADRRTTSAASETSPSALADAGGSSEVTVTTENRSAAVWLIGNVVMISEPAGETMEKSSAERSLKEKSIRPSSSGEMAAAKKGFNEKVILRRRPVKELPADRPHTAAAQGQVETMLEKSDDKLVLTLFDDTVDDTDIQEAVIETLTNDVLIVALPNQRITYHLPSGWNPSTRSR